MAEKKGQGTTRPAGGARSVGSAMELAEEERKRKLLSLRLELAKGGKAAYKAGNNGDAVKSFQAYLKILEDTKNVSEGGLLPTTFDRKKEAAELMMVSAVYWDLVKIFDSATVSGKSEQFLHYMEKYIMFTKGFPYQAVCAESLRKYINHKVIHHREDFKNAYEALSVSSCFIVTSLVDVTEFETVNILRKFRDQVLLNHAFGRAFVKAYYRYAPRIAAQLNHFPQPVRRFLGWCLDSFAHITRLLLGL